MERNTNVVFHFFDQTLVQRVIDFTELSDDTKTREKVSALKEEIKNIYLKKDAELKQYIKEQLVAIKQTHLANVEQLEKKLVSDLKEATQEHENDPDSKEFKNVKFGLETACKRAKRQRNQNDGVFYNFLHQIRAVRLNCRNQPPCKPRN